MPGEKDAGEEGRRREREQESEKERGKKGNMKEGRGDERMRRGEGCKREVTGGKQEEWEEGGGSLGSVSHLLPPSCDHIKQISCSKRACI